MSDRRALARAFVAATPWSGAAVAPVAGDASGRRYMRLTRADTGEAAILMDDPPAPETSVPAFVRIAALLSGAGLSVPDILYADARQGFLLLEDLGDGLYPTVIGSGMASEAALYQTAADVLLRLNATVPPASLPRFTATVLSAQAALVGSWYSPRPDKVWISEFQGVSETLLRRLTLPGEVLIHRDFHAENLIWLPARAGLRRVGLLDFQDAKAGPRGYDLVSLLQDARRDVPADLANNVITNFVEATRSDHAEFAAACAILGALRNLRILGVFARLSRQAGRTGYVELVPRVWRHLMASLSHPELAPLARLVSAGLPAPDRRHLNFLRTRCAENSQ